jgi:hypothetical protein
MFLGEVSEAADVVPVLVGDEDALDGVGSFADQRQPPQRFTPAEASVNQNFRAFRRNQSAVAGAAACQNRYSDADNSPWRARESISSAAYPW